MPEMDLISVIGYFFLMPKTEAVEDGGVSDHTKSQTILYLWEAHSEPIMRFSSLDEVAQRSQALEGVKILKK